VIRTCNTLSHRLGAPGGCLFQGMLSIKTCSSH
jgi:hypothetical protein